MSESKSSKLSFSCFWTRNHQVEISTILSLSLSLKKIEAEISRRERAAALGSRLFDEVCVEGRERGFRIAFY